MPKFSKLSILTSVLILAVSPAAFAQDDATDISSDMQIVDIFTSADIDADGALNRKEFISFVVMKSDQGDADYKSLKISGEYDNHFNTKDYNADGLLTPEELKEETVSDETDVLKEETPLDEPG